MKTLRYSLLKIWMEFDGTSTPVNVSYKSSPLRIQKRLTAVSVGPSNWNKMYREKQPHKHKHACARKKHTKSMYVCRAGRSLR